MVVDVLDPMFCSAVVAVESVPESWLEPLEALFLDTLGAFGNRPSAGTLGTSDAVFAMAISGECALAV